MGLSFWEVSSPSVADRQPAFNWIFWYPVSVPFGPLGIPKKLTKQSGRSRRVPLGDSLLGAQFHQNRGRGGTTWVCLKIVYPKKPNGFADHYPYEMAIIGNIPHFQTYPLLDTETLKKCWLFTIEVPQNPQRPVFVLAEELRLVCGCAPRDMKHPPVAVRSKKHL